MNTITIAAYNRPAYLNQVLLALARSIRACSWRVDTILIGIDPPKSGEDDTNFHFVLDIANFFNLSDLGIKHEVVVWPEHLGVSEAPRRLLQRAFMFGSDYNLHLEDDTVLSLDALNFVQSCESHVDLCCLYSPLGDEAPDCYLIHRHFRVWGWAATRECWRSLISPTWNWKTEHPLGWDASLEVMVCKEGEDIRSPLLSRVTNIGRENGTFQTPEGWDRDFAGHAAATEKDFVPADGWRYVDTD